MTEGELKELLLQDCDECTKIGGKGWIGKQMIHAYGAIEATKRLVCDPKIQAGFTFLMEKNKLELTMEYKVLKYKSLFFDQKTINHAEWKISHWKNLKELPKNKTMNSKQRCRSGMPSPTSIPKERI